jgi:hypothetical protein
MFIVLLKYQAQAARSLAAIVACFDEEGRIVPFMWHSCLFEILLA